MKVFMCCAASFQSVQTNSAATESKPAVKRNQKPGKKPGGKSGKEGSEKSHNSTGETTKGEIRSGDQTSSFPRTCPLFET